MIRAAGLSLELCVSKSTKTTANLTTIPEKIFIILEKEIKMSHDQIKQVKETQDH